MVDGLVLECMGDGQSMRKRNDGIPRFRLKQLGFCSTTLTEEHHRMN